MVAYLSKWMWQTMMNHLLFKGTDVFSTHKVPLTQAILGGNIKVTTLRGIVKTNLPPMTKAGSQYSLNGYGLPDESEKGKMVINFQSLSCELY